MILVLYRGPEAMAGIYNRPFFLLLQSVLDPTTSLSSTIGTLPGSRVSPIKSTCSPLILPRSYVRAT